MASAKILVVEDDPEVEEIVCRYLTQFGFEPISVKCGAGVAKHLDAVELIILDLQLPGEDGLEILRKVRRESQIPILIASARAEGSERIIGLEMGADDYLVKPFLPRELIARVKALLRRARPSRVGRVEDIVLDDKARRAEFEGRQAKFSPQQFLLLQILLANPGRTLSREELMEQVWEGDTEGDVRRVDLLVSKVRTKLADADIHLDIRSVWGVGYEFQGLLEQ